MSKPFVASLLTGLAVGSAVTMFVGNKSGRQRRADMREEMDENIQLVHDLNDSLHEFSDALDTLTETATELVPQFRHDLDKTIDAFKFQAKPRVDEIKNSVNQLKDDLNVE